MQTSDFAWLVEHSTDLQKKYGGKWIAVHAGKVVGVGDTAVEADREAQKHCPEGEYILEAVEASGDTVYGVVCVAKSAVSQLRRGLGRVAARFE